MSQTLVVVDDDKIEYFEERVPNVISFETYLKDYPKRNEAKQSLINLCDAQQYLSKGYYCSLLAEARRHSVLPSVKTVNLIRQLANEEYVFLNRSEQLHLTPEMHGSKVMSYFGKSSLPELQKLSNRIYSKYPVPILCLTLYFDGGKYRVLIASMPFRALNSEEQENFTHNLMACLHTGKTGISRKKQHRWSMAILIDPNEKTPPSNREAIARFSKAAMKFGIYPECVNIDQLQNLSLYDALFIRETTAIDHHTYRMAVRAQENRMVVLDDPTSILRCCNKVFLHDAFTYSNVPSLRTEIITSSTPDTVDYLEKVFSYPLILKLPEGAFSKNVYKIEHRQMLTECLEELFLTSALVIAQEYLYTEFDWRIGILNGRPIYACRYYMAKKYWKIYNHEAKRLTSGRFETLPTFEVPKIVLNTAIKAAKIIGSGLYGVDVKQTDKQAFVIEVNDNPSIDHGVEDKYLGDELYMIIAAEFLRRLELRER